MKTILITLLIMVGVNHTTLAQLKTVDRQVIVMFKSSVVERPLGRETYGLEDLTMPNEVRQILTGASVVQVDKPFPNFSSRDTVRTLRDGRIYRTPDYSNMYVFSLDNASSRDSLIAKLVRSDFVDYAESNGVASPRGRIKNIRSDDSAKIDNFLTPIIPNDSRFNEQWGHLNEDTTGVDINSTNAWTITTGSSSVILGILDWGVKSTNIDLYGKVSGDQTELGEPHGTMIAGIAAAKGNNTGGYVAGVDWNAQIMSRHMGDFIDIAEGIDDIITAGSKVINLSWGSSSNQTVTNALFAAYAAGASLIAANPYDDGSPSKVSDFPAGIAHWMVAVGAMEYDGDPWGNTGSRAYTDFAAPGHNVLTTLTDTQGWCDGTSCAAPFVTGTIGLMLAANPGLKNYEIEQVLKRTAKGWGSPHDGEIGYGMIDAYAALQRVTTPYSVYRNNADFTKIHTTVERNFTSSPGLGYASGTYICDVWEMEASATYNYSGTPVAFLSASAPGYSGANPNNGQLWMDESVSSTSMYLQTFFYYIHTNSGGLPINKWFPYDPTVLDPTYSLIGIANTYPSDPELEVEIDGPISVDPYSIEMFDAIVSNGVSPYSYQWQLQIGSGSWSNVGTDSPVYSYMANPSEHYNLKVTVTDDDSEVAHSPIHEVTVGSMLLSEPPPEEFDLKQNHPNPFNPTTVIHYTLPETAQVRILVYDVTGRLVRQLVDDQKLAGYHEATFDASALSSGVYLTRMHAVGISGKVFTLSRQMTVVK